MPTPSEVFQGDAEGTGLEFIQAATDGYPVIDQQPSTPDITPDRVTPLSDFALRHLFRTGNLPDTQPTAGTGEL